MQTHRRIAEHTVLRRECCVAGGGRSRTSDYESDRPLAKALSRFLQMWNGDWQVACATHICPGPRCCGSRQESVDNMFARALALDF
eukprot:8258263-Pyramimonas_sp.AAC.1